MVRKNVCLLLCVAVLCGMLFPARAEAQKGEDIAKDLLRALIESQLEKSRRKSGGNPDSFRDPQGQGNQRPVQATQEMQKLRPITANIAQESATLTALLNSDSRHNLEVRNHLQPAIQFQAMASVLRQQSELQPNHLALLDGYRGLNDQWTTLAHQLDRSKSLGPQTRECMKRIASLDAQYCSIMGIQDQFNNAELTREAYTLATYLRDLADDLRTTAPRAGTGREQIVRSLGRLSQECDYFAQLVSGGVPFSKAVTEYKRLYQSWQAVEDELDAYPGPMIARAMGRIRESHQSIHELLRLEIGIDQKLVLHMVHEADENLSNLFKSVTLDEMMSMPDAAAVPSAADAAYGNIQNLDDLVHRNESVQAIAEAWVFANEAWEVLAFYLSPSPNARTQASLKSITQTMQSLKRTMGITVSFDRGAMVKSASSLESMGEHLVTAIKRWQSRPGTHNPGLVSQAQSLIDHSHHLEQSLLSGHRGTTHNGTAYNHELDEIIAVWQQIRPELAKCDTDESETINHIIGTFTPELIRLRTMLSQ